MIAPTLNINGSSADDLIDPRIAAYDALHDAIFALQKVTPHGRDYLDDVARYQGDRVLHFERVGRLEYLRKELFSEAMSINDQREEI